jgi:nucleoside-diphosphate-sugar epimerase
VHLAAIPDPGADPDPVVHNNNVTGSYNALRAAVQVGIHRICQASSINAIGAADSRTPRFDYFPLDEAHPTYNEDPYSLSKWICEEQADSIARRYEDVFIASLRFHWVFPRRQEVVHASTKRPEVAVRHLWGYTLLAAAAGASLLSLEAEIKGHERFFIAAPDTVSGISSAELAKTYYPEVPIKGQLEKNASFFDCSKADRLLGWRHNDW